MQLSRQVCNNMNRAFLALILWGVASSAAGQANLDPASRIVAVNARHESPTQILSHLGESLGVSLSYNANLLKSEPITLVADTIALSRVVDSLFIPNGLKLRLIGNRQLVIYSAAEPPEVRDTCYLTLSGQLIDGFTEQEIGRATIIELQTGRMTVSNGEGQFLLKIPCYLENIKLEISAIGYHSLFIDQPSTDTIGMLRMEGDYVALKEVYILNIHADRLMDDVLKNTRRHYTNRPTKATSFLREVILKNNSMVGISEAVFEVYNHPYAPDGKKSQAHLVKGRKFADYQSHDTLVFKLKGSLRSCLDLDIVRHPPFFFDSEMYSQMYVYSFNTVMEYNGRDMYVIDFKHKNEEEALPYEGKMYIDKELKSLTSIEFEISKSALRSMENYFVLRRSKDVNTRLQKARYYVHYTDVEGKLAMNYASFASQFKVRKKNSLFAAKYEVISEYVVNSFQVEEVDKIKPKDAFDAGKVFMDQPIEYSDSYWQGINYLPIDKPLLESADELQRIFLRR